jgi:hypothetical protein
MAGDGDYDPANVLFGKWVVKQGHLEPVSVTPRLESFTFTGDHRDHFRIEVADSGPVGLRGRALL